MSHTRNSSPLPFYSDVSHPELFSASIPSGCLTPGILLRRHSILMSHIRNSARPTFYLIRMSHIWNSSPSPFHPDVSHPEFYPADVQPSSDVSHPESCPPTFNLPPVILHPEFYPVDVPPFSPSLEHFLEAPNIPFSINLAVIFFSASNFRIFHVFKMI